MPAGRDDRAHWNLRYRNEPGGWLNPDSFLQLAFEQFIRPAFPGGGTALDLAGGAGRHSIWLARQGWKVMLIDISETGIELARRRAGRFAPHINFVIDDLTHFRASQTQFDLVMGFFYLERSIFPEVLAAVRPGGFFVYKTYTVEQEAREGEPKDARFLLQPGELRQLAQGLETLHYRESCEPRATAEIVAQKKGRARRPVP